MRKQGFAKTRLVDIARQLGVSHALLYRYFPDKGALLDAVSERWLLRMDDELESIAGASKPALQRIEDWFFALHRLKRQKVAADPELYSAFSASAQSARPFVQRHVQNTRRQLLQMVEDGLREKTLAPAAPQQIVDTLYLGTLAFHHPRLVAESIEKKDRERSLQRILSALLHGLRA